MKSFVSLSKLIVIEPWKFFSWYSRKKLWSFSSSIMFMNIFYNISKSSEGYCSREAFKNYFYFYIVCQFCGSRRITSAVEKMCSISFIRTNWTIDSIFKAFKDLTFDATSFRFFSTIIYNYFNENIFSHLICFSTAVILSFIITCSRLLV